MKTNQHIELAALLGEREAISNNQRKLLDEQNQIIERLNQARACLEEIDAKIWERMPKGIGALVVEIGTGFVLLQWRDGKVQVSKVEVLQS